VLVTELFSPFYLQLDRFPYFTLYDRRVVVLDARQLHKADPSFSENLHCHVFRHSIGMAMYKAGSPISYIKDHFLGHSSIDSTTIYAHADNDTMEEALRSVD
jgi:integrase